MSQTRNDSAPTRIDHHELDDISPQNASTLEEASSRWVQGESHRTRASVLVGSAILQLPIWGFAMSYGVFQEYYSDNWTLKGSRSATGIVGTTQNGVMYLSMPFLFGLFTKRWARRRQTAALCGAVLMAVSFILSSFSTEVWHLVVTQGVMAALGCALIYSPTTLSLGEWFTTRNRAVAYGLVLSTKNIVGSTCPFLFRGLLDRYGFRNALRIWTGMAAILAIPAIFLIPTHPSSLSSSARHTTKIPWKFLQHKTFYIYSVAIVLQSAGYGIPQTYLNTYAHEVALLSQTSATLLLTLFNLPGILSSSFFGYLSDKKRFSLSATTVTAISAISTALSTFLFWGLTSEGSMALLILFSITFGFFAGGYSATWGGVINELEREAADSNEPIDPGLMYGLLNGARGIGYVSGGLASVPLLKAGSINSGNFAYGTTYGPLIVFTGLSTVFGGWGVLWKWKPQQWKRLLHLL
ncbi:putative monocarboxylate transporter [Mollisia scopiformis]|uniref:Putative monocarboxylate transporter n=1 Tax=Mollisia scopiformis TaxID=149040 RepID=A0A194XUK7_MOLSC|nr:putative monocarboxylate transporter [Mollisia scopiformis]KUJ23821.1 putative monocarboxylate transporter [Mollisia scopiformis]